MNSINNILAVGAHPDDLELMAGGTLSKCLKQGKNVHTIIFTHGGWQSPGGKEVRSSNEASQENYKVIQYMGYSSAEQLNYDPLSLQFNDNLTAKVLECISKYNVDTIIYPWNKDTHHDHEVVSRVVNAASRRVQNLLMGQINYYLNDFFTPNIFVDITEEWNNKIEALKLFQSQWERSGEDWYEFLDTTSHYYGKISGVKRAEGFISNRILF
jgi:LmbE family N-acetylglucosaminyl deacetylase